MIYLLHASLLLAITSTTHAFISPPSRCITALASTIQDAPSSLSSPIERVGINSRGAKMNEIDFTLAPSDVSLSRCYQISRDGGAASTAASTNETQESRVQTLSLTRALNTASNRAVRRILLARSWPSAEALNLSLRTVLMQQSKQEEQLLLAKETDEEEEDKAKCPVPRPILNILMNRREGDASSNMSSDGSNPVPRTVLDKEKQWVATQLAVFKDSYQNIPGYEAAEAYLECILSLATVGIESDRVDEVMRGGVYAEAYRRMLSVIQSVGAVLETVPGSNKKRIASKLRDIDLCLSMLDKIAMTNEKTMRQQHENTAKSKLVSVDYDAAARLAYESDDRNKSMSFAEFKDKYIAETVAMVAAKKKQREELSIQADAKEEEPKGAYEKGRARRLFASFRKKSEDSGDDQTATATIEGVAVEETPDSNPTIQPDDLGGVLLSAEEPTMTRQLNILSNIVQRTLIFGGDQEVLVLSETLDADKPAFIKRWYKDNQDDLDIYRETRPGVMYLNALIQLLRDCYSKGVIYDSSPKVPLTSGYANAYGRLIASLIEFGSGYVRPAPSSLPLSLALSAPAATAKYLTETAPPKSAQEELGRFVKWEKAVRKDRINPYPEDFVGTWNVQDIVGGSVIGTTKVTFRPAGEVIVEPPMQGLRWRLDPGPTHLDTCTFQVLSDDGAILQYKGFVDRGSRLEARISKRSVSMRGGISFLMRDAELSGGGALSDDYWDDMLPMNYKSGMTKFTMTRIVEGSEGKATEESDASD